MGEIIRREDFHGVDLSGVIDAEAPPLPDVTPGRILAREFLEPLGLTPHALALALRVPPNRTSGIVNGARAIAADTAMRPARHLGTGVQFRMNLQIAHDLLRTGRDAGARIRREVQPRVAAEDEAGAGPPRE